MTEPFLIAHKVRGQPAFDIAERIECAECHGPLGCTECDHTGHWWIIPTSGHRAYPVETWTLSSLIDLSMPRPTLDQVPDHYPHNAEPSKPKLDISALLATAKPVNIRRL